MSKPHKNLGMSIDDAPKSAPPSLASSPKSCSGFSQYYRSFFLSKAPAQESQTKIEEQKNLISDNNSKSAENLETVVNNSLLGYLQKASKKSKNHSPRMGSYRDVNILAPTST